ncbi:flavin reductase [Flavobacteriales bacterium]|nr:flavin reductase [Flavobacteriales bacterium]
MKRPWNIVSPTVYSLVTYNSNNRLNMNICTYVSAISMQPKMYSIAIDYNTLSYQNLKKSSEPVILQLLSIENSKLVRKLGKSSGFKTNKEEYLAKKGLLANYKNRQILKNINGLVVLKKNKVIEDLGDHALFIFDVIGYKTFSQQACLNFQDLVNQKIIL